jgi:uncharacterized SAM-binding protein YcdF (DUF218 family)
MKASATYRSGKSSARPKSFRAGWAQAEGGGILFRLLAMGTLIVLVLVGMAFYRSILGTLGSWLVVQEPPARADAIIVLSGDSPRAPRAARAAELYRAGWAPVVVASGTALRSYFSEADLMAQDLLRDGVPKNSIIPFRHTARYTLAEAQALAAFCTERGWHRLLVVTSNYHTRRADYIFHQVFPPADRVRVIAAQDVDFDPYSWWTTREGTKLFIRELVGLGVAFWELH